MSQARAPTCAFSKVWHPRHALSAAREHNVRAPKHYFFGGENDCAQTRAACLVHGKRRYGFRDARAKGDLTRDIRSTAGLARAPPDGIFNLSRLNIRAPQPLLGTRDPQTRRGPTRQRTAETSDRSANCGC